MRLPVQAKPSDRDSRRHPLRGAGFGQIGVLPHQGEDDESEEIGESDESEEVGESDESGD